MQNGINALHLKKWILNIFMYPIKKERLNKQNLMQEWNCSLKVALTNQPVAPGCQQ